MKTVIKSDIVVVAILATMNKAEKAKLDIFLRLKNVHGSNGVNLTHFRVSDPFSFP